MSAIEKVQYTASAISITVAVAGVTMVIIVWIGG